MKLVLSQSNVTKTQTRSSCINSVREELTFFEVNPSLVEPPQLKKKFFNLSFEKSLLIISKKIFIFIPSNSRWIGSKRYWSRFYYLFERSFNSQQMPKYSESRYSRPKVFWIIRSSLTDFFLSFIPHISSWCIFQITLIAKSNT